jgi:hypothetical protein
MADGLFMTTIFPVISLLFGVGSIGYAVVARMLDRKKYEQEVRASQADADLKGEEFWKGRYDVLAAELDKKESWWKERYDNLYQEVQNERRLSNEMMTNFRNELNKIRDEYEAQRQADRDKYNRLMEEFRTQEREANAAAEEYKRRISDLEASIVAYEDMIKSGKRP